MDPQGQDFFNFKLKDQRKRSRPINEFGLMNNRGIGLSRQLSVSQRQKFDGFFDFTCKNVKESISIGINQDLEKQTIFYSIRFLS